jgi:predicted transcriptional regulator
VICTSEKSFFAIERKVRKRRLLDLIKENPNMPEGKLKGLFSLKTGLTFNRIDAYIMELEESGLIERDEAGQLKATDSA